jgi:putative phage-type endonuclease
MRILSPDYEILALDQGSEEWKQERLKRVTASQVPSLMGLSPYQTPLDLLREKITGQEIEVSSYKQVLFAKGHNAERSAREWIESNFNAKFPPAVLLSKKCPDLLASLDGLNIDKNTILEAKYMGSKALLDVKRGKIKPHHLCQIQCQLLVSGAEKCIYFATTEGGESAIAEIKPDSSYSERILKAVCEFVKDVNEYKQYKENLVSKYSPPKLKKGEIFRVRTR